MRKLKSLMAAFSFFAIGGLTAKAQTVPYDPDMGYETDVYEGNFISQNAVESVARMSGVDEAYPRARVGFSSGLYGSEYIGLEWRLNGYTATVVNAYNLNNIQDAMDFEATKDRARELENALILRNIEIRIYDSYQIGRFPRCNNWYSGHRSHNHFYYGDNDYYQVPHHNNGGHHGNNGYNNNHHNGGTRGGTRDNNQNYTPPGNTQNNNNTPAGPRGGGRR